LDFNEPCASIGGQAGDHQNQRFSSAPLIYAKKSEKHFTKVYPKRFSGTTHLALRPKSGISIITGFFSID